MRIISKILFVVGGIGIALAIFFVYSIVDLNNSNERNKTGLLAVDATVLSNEYDNESAQYFAEVSYVVDNNEYRIFINNVTEKDVPGTVTTIYCKPEDPSQVLIEPNQTDIAMLRQLAFRISVVSIVLIGIGLKLHLNSKKAAGITRAEQTLNQRYMEKSAAGESGAKSAYDVFQPYTGYDGGVGGYDSGGYNQPSDNSYGNQGMNGYESTDPSGFGNQGMNGYGSSDLNGFGSQSMNSGYGSFPQSGQYPQPPADQSGQNSDNY